MVGRDGAEARKERLQRIARTIQAALHKEGEIPLSKTIAALQYEMGLTREKLQEYLEVLRDLGQFVMDFEQDKIKKADVEEPKDKNQGG
jgi:predicted solute-binding protein